MEKRRLVLVAVACCALLALAGVAGRFLTLSAQAGTHNFTQNLSGTYAWRCTGNTAPGPEASSVPAVGQGTVVSDHEGVFRGGGTLSLGGQILQQRIEEPAVANSDGTGSIVYKVWIVLPDGTEIPGPDWHINLVILDHGNGIWGMPYDGGSAMSCTLERMEKDEK